jgi:hypothetical protein
MWENTISSAYNELRKYLRIKPSSIEHGNLFFHISMIGGSKFCGNVGKSDAFPDFPKYCA